jgi:glycosyltransferase involved in cell wall biosynthesis
MTTTRTPPNLQDLPPPPPDKQGWPWTVATVPLPLQQSNGTDWPRISIVTPSYNQGEFIEETIRSVLLQGYPNLEYIIIDGGSTDTTLAMIKKYQPYIAHWVSEPDRGQSHALNKGFQQATGDFVGWQNSDDFYAIDALATLAHTYQQDPDIDILYGSTKYVDRDSNFLNFYPVEKNFTLTSMFPWTSLCNRGISLSLCE